VSVSVSVLAGVAWRGSGQVRSGSARRRTRAVRKPSAHGQPDLPSAVGGVVRGDPAGVRADRRAPLPPRRV